VRSGPPFREARVSLEGGRALGFAEFGDPGGHPVLYFHGFPSSRLEARIAGSAASRLRIRLIALDRPGYGLSDFQPDRTLLDWPGDVTAFADALAMERFSLLGISGGAPYAAACALDLADRLVSVGIVCGLGPVDVPECTRDMTLSHRLAFFLSLRTPRLARSLFRVVASDIRRDPRRFLAAFTAQAPEPDRRILRREGIRQALLEAFREAVRGGPEGCIHDLGLYSRPWGLSLEKIEVGVNLWHGEKDQTVPAAMGRYLAKTIPRTQATFIPGEGHFSLPIKHMETILRTLRPA
jgi:pimeloyl-ACP methyl ester carboxylesterase